MKRTTFFLIAAVAAPLIVHADTPTTRPSERPTTQPTRPFGRGEGNGPRFGNRDHDHEPWQQAPAPTAQEIDDTLAFVKTKFPNHYKLFIRLPENSAFRTKALPKMVWRFRQLQHMQDQMPGAYQALLDQACNQDQALGFAIEKNEGHPDAEQQLRKFVGDMVDHTLQERKKRIDHLEQELSEQKRKLDEDQQKKDELVEQQINRTEQEFNHLTHGGEHGGTGDGKSDGQDGNANHQ